MVIYAASNGSETIWAWTIVQTTPIKISIYLYLEITIINH